ncbi:type II toxin-antitoxin system PemK/MazF family toxin [Gloeobacter violaceus]|uniref:Glr0126 protein n=1 Tax=Gloeobacter violaceus (strain ATCC 29082 / PCC 7421) TaxID=251221 RepID=Q7NPC9_GLOVI|nr:type II toxin-antitoxin system PemK/MazF family toxin [Gloeobacter violaceus]BAC88067.1 glr0126 [Gloeobacter violaceus PCC 7421]
MPSTIPYDFGDIILVAFPFSDLKTKKKRPAVVVSSSFYQTRYPDVILMAVTSQIQTPQYPGEVLIADWQAAGLLKASVTKPVLATVETELIIRKLGQLASADQEAVRATLLIIFG